MKYMIGIDQSTQGTKAILFNEAGELLERVDKKHEQIVNEKGWVSHNPEEIYKNLIAVVKEVVQVSGIDKKNIAGVGISNQRETTVMWDEQGKPAADAIVWQCARAEEIAVRLKEYASIVYEKTGLPLSPYFPASKMTWLMEHTDHKESGFHFGTVDSWLIYKLTGGKSFKTDYSNASRTQLFNLHTLSWDSQLCEWFGIPIEALPEVCDSNACYGETDFEGFLETPIPIHGVMGDSHAALYGQGCHKKGMVKTTYGTGSSIMMNIGDAFIKSEHGLATSLAWGRNGKVEYVLEGNINYTGAVISWMQNDVHLISSPAEVEKLIERAHAEDTTILVPAFSGLGAPYWRGDAKALMYGMSRTTGQAEMVKAATESIAYQITDVLKAMEQDSKAKIQELRVDGGPTKNHYLMQFQSDMASVDVCVASNEELSAIGVAYMAGIAVGICDSEKIFQNLKYKHFTEKMDIETRQEKYAAWQEAVSLVLSKG